VIKRVLLIVGTVSLFSVLTAAPALAATAKFVSPTPGSGQTVKGSQTIQVEASPNPGLLGLGGETVERVTVTIRPVAGTGGSGKEYSAAGKSLRFSWDTHPLYNGGYDLEADATPSSGSPDRISNVRVNNPPARPGGLKAAPDGPSVTLTWAANKEPDLIDYEVRRSVNNGSFDKLADVKGTTYKDTSAQPDQKVRYQVVASRRSATGGTIDSAASEPSATLTIPPAAAPPPAPAADPAAAAAAPASAPAPGPGVAKSPAAQKFFGRTSFKTLPARDIGFEPTLPFTAPVPQKFEPATKEFSRPSGSTTESDSGQFSGSLTQVHPARFLAAGLLLLVTSAHLARASRRLLKPAGGTSPRRAKPAAPVSQST
jgi:hypothetical protein